MNRASGHLLVLLSTAFLVVLIVYFEPHFWLQGIHLDPFRRFFRGWAIFSDHSTGTVSASFLFGKISNTGWWYYYLAAMLAKIPLPILILFFLGLAHLISSKKILRPEILLLAVPPVFYWAIASFVNQVNIGVRHILIVYPFLIVTAGAAFELLGQGKLRKIRPFVIGLSAVWLITTRSEERR